MTKRPSLAESMKTVAQPVARLVPVSTEAEPSARAEAPKPAARAGMKRATAILTPDEHRRLRRLSLDTDRSLEALLTEAVTDLLAKHHV